ISCFAEDFKQRPEPDVENTQTNVNREVRKTSQGVFKFHSKMDAIDVRTGTICPKLSGFRVLLMVAEEYNHGVYHCAQMNHHLPHPVPEFQKHCAAGGTKYQRQKTGDEKDDKGEKGVFHINVYVCTTFTPEVHKGQKSISDLLELQMVMNYHLGAGN
ncbi:hypothetical protein STEG23_035732, partial [Scotinomys teguina]